MPMGEIPNAKQYDLEERTFVFAKYVRSFLRKLPKATELTNIFGAIIQKSK